MAATTNDTASTIAASAKSYNLRPIIILITEEDKAAFDWVLRNKESLFTLGYRTLNIEQCHDSSWKEFADPKKKKIIADKRNTFKNAKFNNESEFSRTWKNLGINRLDVAEGFSIVCEGICSDNKWSYNFIDVESKKLSSLNLVQIREKLTSERETRFTQEISRSSNDSLGGTITIIGNNHVTVFSHLQKINPICAERAIFITMQKFSPLECTGINASLLADINASRKLSYDKNTKERQENLKHFLPKGSYFHIDFTNDKFTNDLDKVIFKKIVLIDTPKDQPNPTITPKFITNKKKEPPIQLINTAAGTSEPTASQNGKSKKKKRNKINI